MILSYINTCDPKYCIIVFNNEIHICDRINFECTVIPMKNMKFDIENILDHQKIGDNFILFIDNCGKIYIYQLDKNETFEFNKIPNTPKIN